MSDPAELMKLPAYRSTMDQLEAAKHVSPTGENYWRAREIHAILGYPGWRNFTPVIERARDALVNNRLNPSHHIAQARNMMAVGGGAVREGTDFFLTRAACYLIAMNGDPAKPEIAAAQAYFAIQTRRMEVRDAAAQDKDRIALRGKVRDANKHLNETAQGVGVERFGLFHDAGYRGLYDMGLPELRKHKGIGRDHPLDRAGLAELAANAFRITQTEEKLRVDRVQGESSAIDTRRMVGRTVRDTIKKLGGTMPENLSVEPPIKDVAKRLARRPGRKLIED